MISKTQVYEACIKSIDAKISNLENMLAELKDGIENESKSSAGDKHETSRAILHNEQEKISKQWHETLLQKATLEQVSQIPNPTKVGVGSLIKTNKGYLFLSIALGKVQVNGKDVFVISPQSPLGAKINGLKEGEQAEMNGIKYIVEELF